GAHGAGQPPPPRRVLGELEPLDGEVTRCGGLGVMRQLRGREADGRPVRHLLVGLAPPAVRDAARELEAAELDIMTVDDEKAQMRYAHALAEWAGVGGYEAEAGWDLVTDSVLSIPFEKAQWRDLATLSGGEQKRLMVEALLRGPEEVLLLDEPDNHLDVPTKRWLEDQILASPKTILFISHDRELLARVATHVATLEPTAAGAGCWVHGGGFSSYHQAREERLARLAELRRRWDEEHEKLRTLVATLRVQAASSDKMTSRYHAAQTRLRRFEDAGPPEESPQRQLVRMRLAGGRTAKRAVACTGLALTGLKKPFNLEVWFGERVAVLGSNGSGKSHFLRLLAAGGTDPEPAQRPDGDVPLEPVAHSGTAVLGARVV